MSIISPESTSWVGRTLTDSDHRRLGTIEEIYLDERARPQWMVVRTGRFANKRSFVPLGDAVRSANVIVTPHDKRQIDDAPTIVPDDELLDDQVRALYRYYDLPFDTPIADRPDAAPQSAGDRILQYLA